MIETNRGSVSITHVIRIDLDPSRGLVLPLVLETEHCGLVVQVVLQNAAPQELYHLVLKI